MWSAFIFVGKALYKNSYYWGVFFDSQSQDSMSKAMDEAKQSQLRGMADLDARIASLQSKIASQEESLEDRILGVGDLLWPLTCGVRIIYS